MKKTIIEKNGKKTIRIELSPEEDWEDDVINSILEWTNRRIYSIDFFHFYYRGDTITIEEQGYNTPTIEMLMFDVSKFKKKEKYGIVKVGYATMLHRLKSHPIQVVNNLFYHDFSFKPSFFRRKKVSDDEFEIRMNLEVEKEMLKEEENLKKHR